MNSDDLIFFGAGANHTAINDVGKVVFDEFVAEGGGFVEEFGFVGVVRALEHLKELDEAEHRGASGGAAHNGGVDFEAAAMCFLFYILRVIVKAILVIIRELAEVHGASFGDAVSVHWGE